jgi:hypothetical protein
VPQTYIGVRVVRDPCHLNLDPDTVPDTELTRLATAYAAAASGVIGINDIPVGWQDPDTGVETVVHRADWVRALRELDEPVPMLLYCAPRDVPVDRLAVAPGTRLGPTEPDTPICRAVTAGRIDCSLLAVTRGAYLHDLPQQAGLIGADADYVIVEGAHQLAAILAHTDTPTVSIVVTSPPGL